MATTRKLMIGKKTLADFVRERDEKGDKKASSDAGSEKKKESKGKKGK